MEDYIKLLQESIDEIEGLIDGIEDMEGKQTHKQPYYWTSDEIKLHVSQIIEKLISINSSQSSTDLMEEDYIKLLQESIDEIEGLIDGIEDMEGKQTHKQPYYWTSNEIKLHVSQIIEKLINDENA